MKSLKVLLPLIALAAVAAAPLAPAAESASSAASSSETKLTEAQLNKIAELRRAEHRAIQEVKDNKKIKDADKPAKIKAIKEDYKAQIAAIKGGK